MVTDLWPSDGRHPHTAIGEWMMRGLPADFDGSAFVGHDITAVCVSENTIQLMFDGSLMLKIERSFAYGQDVVGSAGSLSSDAAAWLVSRPGRTIAEITVLEGRHLRLRFDDGQEMTFLDEERFESYVLTIGDREIIV